MSEALRIREATPADVDRIVEFNQLMALETENRQLPTAVLRPGVAAVLTNPTLGRYFLACHTNRPIGQLMLTTEWSDWRNGQLWWIQSVYVDREHRRSGVFRQLYQHVERLAESTAGVAGLRLYVEHHNAVAQRVYEQLGMTPAGYVVFEKIFVDARG